MGLLRYIIICMYFHSSQLQDCRPIHIGGDMDDKITPRARARLDATFENVTAQLEHVLSLKLMIHVITTYGLTFSTLLEL